MSISRARWILFLAALMLLLAGVACGQLNLSQNQPRQTAWTPAPLVATTRLAGAEAILTAATAALQAEEPAATEVVDAAPLAAEPAAGGSGAAAATGIPAGAATSVSGGAPHGVPTADPHHVVITESDIAAVIAGGAGSAAGVQTQGLAVRFAGGKTHITADSVSYGLIAVNNLAVTGVLVARDGVLQLDTESVSPQGLVGTMVPGMINQALRQYTGQWYVEDVQTLDGRIELRVR